MRFAMTLVATLAIAGCQPKDGSVESLSSSPAIHVSESQNSNELADSKELKTVSVTVTGMMCPHGCYPEVKSLISKKNDIESIELGPQTEKDAIDNPVVMVKYRGVFDKVATSKAIIDAGFEKVDFVDQ